MFASWILGIPLDSCLDRLPAVIDQEHLELNHSALFARSLLRPCVIPKKKKEKRLKL